MLLGDELEALEVTARFFAVYLLDLHREHQSSAARDVGACPLRAVAQLRRYVELPLQSDAEEAFQGRTWECSSGAGRGHW